MSQRFIVTEGIAARFFVREFDNADEADEYVDNTYGGDLFVMDANEVDTEYKSAKRLLREAEERVAAALARVQALDRYQGYLEDYINEDGTHEPIPSRVSENRYRNG